MARSVPNLQHGYDAVADEYVARIADELRRKPLDRELLTRLAARTKDRGLICDMGCGPGHVGRYLREQGALVVGVDLSAGMIARARQLNPDIAFMQGDMLRLDVPDASWAGIAAFYSIIHIPREQVVDALCEFKRVLMPEGLVLLTFHVGSEIVHLDEMWGQAVSLDFIFFEQPEMEDYVQAAGFEIEESLVRRPYRDVEHQSQRCYILARKVS